MNLKDFKQSGTARVKVYTNELYTIIQDEPGKNKFNLLASSFYSGIEWEEAHRKTGTINEIKKYIQNK